MSEGAPSSERLDSVVILDRRGTKRFISLTGDMVTVPGLGVFACETLRSALGRVVRVGASTVLVLRPSVRDLRETMDREAQALTHKDLAAILYGIDIAPGARVLEAGAGSGTLTTVLARAVGPTGRVHSYDLRGDFLDVARANAERAAASSSIEFVQGDVRAGISEHDLDAVVLDIPDPWNAIAAAWQALRPCGHLAMFSPNMEQVKGTVAAIRALPFVDTRTVELIEREMEVRDIGVRPSAAALGHTGYLTFARKVLDPFP